MEKGRQTIMNQCFPNTGTTRIEKRKRVPCETGIGFTHVADGFEQCEYSVLIDWAQVERMAHKAAKNKSAKCKLGPVTVNIVGRRPVQ